MKPITFSHFYAAQKSSNLDSKIDRSLTIFGEGKSAKQNSKDVIFYKDEGALRVEFNRLMNCIPKKDLPPHVSIPITHWRYFLLGLKIISQIDSDFIIDALCLIKLLADLYNLKHISQTEAKEWFEVIPSYCTYISEGTLITFEILKETFKTKPWFIANRDDYDLYEQLLGFTENSNKITSSYNGMQV